MSGLRVAILAIVGMMVAAMPAAAAGHHRSRRDAAAWPFASSSPWNVPIGSRAAYEPPGAACTSGITGTSSTDVNAAQYSHPVVVARDSDPVRTITVDDATVATIHVPDGATPSAGDDSHLHVIDPTHHYVDEMYQARPTAGGFDATSHTRNLLRGSGVGSGGERAYGGSAIGGLIRTAELTRGRIPHAVAFALPRSRQRHGFVWPATSEDTGGASTYRGSVPMGTLAAIPPSIHLRSLGLSPAGLVVARALRDYGAYDVDSSSDFTLYAEPSAESLVAPLRADLPKLRDALRCVTNNTPSSVGGGGHRRAHRAPGFRP